LPYRAVSSDGLDWQLEPAEPLLDASGPPFVSIETPSVVRFDGQFHMFYTGVYPAKSPTPFAIGHAVSTDGINWQKDPEAFLTPTGKSSDWNGMIIGEPGAVVYAGAIRVYFTAVGKAPGSSQPASQTIGHVTTQDGVSHSDPEIDLEQTDTYPESQGYFGYSTPMALVHEGNIHLFHDVIINSAKQSPAWQQVALAHAVSRDGGVSFQQDERPVFTRDDFDWTGGEIRSPTALIDNGEVRLWFAGMVPVSDFRPLIVRGIKGPEFGIGYSSISIDEFSAEN
jgi:sucrose-6-phosphate hydrolase SacC (GH32 family)